MKSVSRYERHLLLLDFNLKSQQKIEKSRVGLVGVGGVGNIVAYYLGAAGIGWLKIIDFDIIEESNLNRQLLYREEDINSYKVIIAKKRLEQINPSVRISEVNDKVSADNIQKHLRDVDVVVEAVDNFSTRNLLNKFCCDNEIPFVHAGVQGFQGQVLSVNPKKSACFECIFPNIRDSGRNFFPILGPAAGFTGTLGASEVLKIVTGWGKPLYNKMWVFDIKNCISQVVPIEKREDCKVCGLP